jgi:ADP-ribose pyrophosphatase YjhB (NUDIX family)
MSVAQTIALWADQLRDISAMGLRFSNNIYDQENYQKIQDITLQMLALAVNESQEELEPLRAPLISRPTPLSTGDAAIINEAGCILLIRRADNQKWAMPGGALAVGETPAAGVVREAFEETGVRCEPITLVGIHDSRYCGTTSRHQLYQFLFLCHPLDDGKAQTPPSHADEVLAIQWFAEDSLPTDLDPGHVSRIAEAFRVWRGDSRAYFDPCI